MKRSMGLIAFVLVLFYLFIGIVNADGGRTVETDGVKLFIPDSEKVEGSIKIAGETSKAKIKLLVEKGTNKTWYDVSLRDGKFSEEIWLNQGIGEYTIYVMVHAYDRKYSYGPKLLVDNISDINKYLYPEKYVESNCATIKEKTAQITKGYKNDLDKAKAIYQWVKDNIEYDYDKYEQHKKGNYDNNYGALQTLSAGKGVCFDYAALTAALSRAAGIQCKIIAGEGRLNGVNGSHAWNELYIKEEKRWLKLDTTFAAVSQNNFFDNSEFDECHISQ